MKLDLIGLVTSDMAQSIAFYRLLGWEIPEPEPNEPHFEITLPNGLRIAWDTVELMKQLDADWVQAVGHRMGMAFLCDSPADVNARYEEITAAGYEGAKAPWDAFWGQRYAQLKDPDGNLVDLFCPLPE